MITINQPLGSDDVSFSFDDLSSLGGPEPSSTQTPSAPLNDGAHAQTQVLSHEPDSEDAMSPTASPQTAGEPKASHTWVGLGLVVVALALIASTTDIASLLDSWPQGGAYSAQAEGRGQEREQDR